MIDDEIKNSLINNLLIPGAILAAGVYILQLIWKQICDLKVEGNANEWVVIIRNGKVITSAVGISTYRMPGDQVARFPSKVNKVVFSTEQVTKEM